MMIEEEQIPNLLKFVEIALNQLYERDFNLIENRIHERAIVFRFALYFNELLEQSEFQGLDLDFEYNKREKDFKITPSRPNGSYPDHILHRRGDQESNQVIMEFKCAWIGYPHDSDHIKLQEYTLQNLENGYYYGLGIFVKLGVQRDQAEMIFFINGERQ